VKKGGGKEKGAALSVIYFPGVTSDHLTVSGEENSRRPLEEYFRIVLSAMGTSYRGMKRSDLGPDHMKRGNMRKLDQTWSVRGVGGYKGRGGVTGIPHTYLEGVIPFMYWGYGL